MLDLARWIFYHRKRIGAGTLASAVSRTEVGAEATAVLLILSVLMAL